VETSARDGTRVFRKFRPFVESDRVQNVVRLRMKFSAESTPLLRDYRDFSQCFREPAETVPR
jgi:hypothetical protein